VLFSALGGAIVDRADRKLIFVITQTAFLLMALFLRVFDYLGIIRVWHLLLISALTGLFVSFEQPVRQSILPESGRGYIGRISCELRHGLWVRGGSWWIMNSAAGRLKFLRACKAETRHVVVSPRHELNLSLRPEVIDALPNNLTQIDGGQTVSNL
jgi:hypothetical protein